VTVFADTAEKKIYTPGVNNFLLKGGAFGSAVLRRAVKDVGVPRPDVDMRKKVIPHKIVVALGMIRRQPRVFIHIEGDDIGKRKSPGFMEIDKFPIDTQGASSGGETKNKLFFVIRFFCTGKKTFNLLKPWLWIRDRIRAMWPYWPALWAYPA
jgi:hypothetical protein